MQGSFDGNSLKVAELLFNNGFKEAYAIKGGLRGPEGWQVSHCAVNCSIIFLFSLLKFSILLGGSRKLSPSICTCFRKEKEQKVSTHR